MKRRRSLALYLEMWATYTLRRPWDFYLDLSTWKNPDPGNQTDRGFEPGSAPWVDNNYALYLRPPSAKQGTKSRVAGLLWGWNNTQTLPAQPSVQHRGALKCVRASCSSPNGCRWAKLQERSGSPCKTRSANQGSSLYPMRWLWELLHGPSPPVRQTVGSGLPFWDLLLPLVKFFATSIWIK